MRAARANLRYRLRYIGHLIGGRNWLAGDRLTSMPTSRLRRTCPASTILATSNGTRAKPPRPWYARMESRTVVSALRPERLPGMTPSVAYANLDFSRAFPKGRGELGFDACRVASASRRRRRASGSPPGLATSARGR